MNSAERDRIEDEGTDTGEPLAEPTFRGQDDDAPWTLAEFCDGNAEDEELPEWRAALEALPVGGTYDIAVHFGWNTITRVS